MDVTFRIRSGAHHVIPMCADVTIVKSIIGLDEHLVLSVPREVSAFQKVRLTALDDMLVIQSSSGARIASIAQGLEHLVNEMYLQSRDAAPANVSIRLLEGGDGSAEMVLQTKDRIILKAGYLYMLSDLAGRRIGDLDPYPVPDTSDKPINQTSNGGA